MEEQNLEVVQQKKSIFHSGLFRTIIILILLIIIVSILSFLNFIPLKTLLSKLNPPPKAPSPTTKAQTVDLQCPVSFKYCREAIPVLSEKQPGIAYNLPSGTSVLSIYKLLSYTVENKVSQFSNIKVLHASFIRNNKCYVVSYTMPKSSSVNKLDEVPINKGVEIAKVTNEYFTLDKSSFFNLMIQLQEKDIDPKLAGKADSLRCTVLNKNISDMGSYIKPDIQKFD